MAEKYNGLVQARKDYDCHECKRVIERYSVHESHTVLVAGQPTSHRTCLTCLTSKLSNCGYCGYCAPKWVELPLKTLDELWALYNKHNKAAK